MNPEIGLTTPFGERENISLKSLAWDGFIDGLILTCTNSQEYANTGKKPLEISYTFPLSWDSVVTEFAAEIDGKRLVATALPKNKAEAKYEKALSEGDLPLLLQCSDEILGLFTANLGNLKPGEKVKIEITTAQVLLWNQGEVRLNLPTVIGERYSATGQQGNLLPHEKVSSSIFANYQGTVRINVKGPLAKAKMTCLNHVATFLPQADVTLLEIQNATPDRDIAFLFSEVEAVPMATRVAPREHPELAAEVCTFYTMPTKAQTSINLNVLVDCSGSMEGIPMQQAKKALFNLLENLHEGDTVTFTRFGSTFHHDIAKPIAITPLNLRRDLNPLVNKLDADLGGTELAMALLSVFDLSNSASDILLITDGEIWDAEDVIKKAIKGNHRIFVVGVSSSPAEPLLRQLADKTHGACTVVMPAEDMKSALLSIVEKMRTQQLTYRLSRESAQQEVKLWAGQSATYIWNESKPSGLPELKCISDSQEVVLSPDRWTPSSDISLYRALFMIHANELYKKATDEEVREEIAEKYGLLSPYVSYVLIHERVLGDKSYEMPEAQLVPQMVNKDIFYEASIAPTVLEAPIYGEGTSYDDFVMEAPSFMSQEQSESVKASTPKAPKKSKKQTSKKLKASPKVKSSKVLKDSKDTKKSQDFVLSPKEESWVRTTLGQVNDYLGSKQWEEKLCALIPPKLITLLSQPYAEKLPENDRLALVIVILDLYLQKYADNSSKLPVLTDATKEILLRNLPWQIDFIASNQSEILPFLPLKAFLDEEVKQVDSDF